MMYSLPQDVKGYHIHFVGIKGTGMVALVEILNARGALVTGSDVKEKFYTDEILEKLNIIPLEFSSNNITDSVQLVIYSSAYNQTNPDIARAKEKNIPTILYSEALGMVSKMSFSAGVCGVHGKTTTTGIIGTILEQIDIPSQVLAGSIISSFGNSCTMTHGDFSITNQNQKRFFVAETCEYQKHFMAFCPQKIILTSVESDHQDFYPTYNDIRDAFVDYVLKLPSGGDLIFCADDKGAKEVSTIVQQKRHDINLIPYGKSAQGDYKITLERVQNGKQYFSFKALGECALCIPGEHNVKNAVAAVALVTRLIIEAGKNPLDYTQKIKDALLLFKGGKRRSEILAHLKTPRGQDVIFIDDYGHHPTAINATLKGYREFYKNHKIIVDFMSHTYTRTAALLNDFASSFSYADAVIINKIYGSAREKQNDFSVTGKILADKTKENHKNVIYCAEFDDAAKFGYELLCKDCSKEFSEGYIFVTMGAGDNWKVGQKIIQKLKAQNE